MPLNFPTSPSVNQQYTFGGRTWIWNGSAWDSYNPGITAYVSTFNGLTGDVSGVSSFNGLTGAVTGVTGVNSGSGISITGTTNLTINNTGVTGLNGLTGGLTIFGGTGMSVSAGAKGITLVNTGVWSFNGLTGAVSGVTTSVANVFGPLQTFNNGISAAGMTVVTLFVTGNLTASGGVTFTVSETVLIEDNIITLNANETGAPTLNSGIEIERGTSPNVQLLWNESIDRWTFTNDGTQYYDLPVSVVNTLNGLTGGLTLFGDSGITVTAGNKGITFTNTGVLSNTAGSGINVNTSTGNVTITNIGVTGFNGLTGNVTGVTAVNAGTGISITGTTNPTVTNTGVLSFNGLTGAVSGVSSLNGLTGAVTGVTTSVENIFTALQTFNAGITTSGITLNGTLVASGLGTFNRGITASGATFTGPIFLSSGQGLTQAVTSFNGLTGSVTGVTGVNAGSGILISGTTNPTITNTGVTGFNGLTGNVSGVTAVNAGTGISITGTTNPTVTNTGVQSFNGLTGAVTGVTTSVANTFTALNTFNAGISSAGGTFSSLTRFTAGLSAAGITTSSLRVTGTSTFDGDISASTIRQNGAFPLYIQNFVDTIYIGDGLGEGNGTYFAISDQSTAAELIINTFDITAYTTCTSPDQTAGAALTVNTDSSLFGAGNCFQVTNTFDSSTPVQISSAGAMSLTGRLTASGGISASGGVTFAGKINPIQGVVSGYPRIEWAGLTSSYDIIPSNWASMSAPISTSPTANDAYFAPIFVTQRIRITAIGHQNGSVTSGNTGSFMVGLYDSDQYGYPANRLYGSASTTLSTGSFATQRVTGVNTTVNPGQYWLAIVFSAAGLTGLGRLGSRMKIITPTSSSPIGQSGVDGLRKAQGGFTLSASQSQSFTAVVGNDNPCIFYNGEAV